MAPRRTLPARPHPTLQARLTPLVAALAACWPLWVAGAARPPAPNAVPVPTAGWRVYGNGSAAPVNTPNGQGGIDQKIRQDSQRAIYQWQSFDIGAHSSVTFDMALKNASALNRVLGSTAPSQIFGKLSATNGGEIYLINANGILFGRGAQVNTGSLVASALNLSDTEYLSGLTNSLLYDKTRPAFAYDGLAENFVDSKNFVRVDDGATITTANGGRVFLFAKRVENAGQISTPGGQAMLAAGGQVYLQPPSDQGALYASEANPEVPTLRGLLVEVGAGPAGAPEGGHGSVVNEATGRIDTPRGNATLVAMAVNQMGRISATTSVTENGSIILRAQGDAKSRNEGVRATGAGALVLGTGSQTTIAPDDGAAGNDGKPLTSDGNATFVNPRIDLAGASVLLDSGAQVVAPGATVDVRAERVPNYEAYDKRTFRGEGAGDASRIVLADDAVIDVSGTTTAVDSVERYFVTTGLLGSNDLKDAPLQKDGLLYRGKATIDVREDSAILGDLGNYRDGIQQTIDERLSAGGQVRLTAGGGVLTHADSRIDVSGGQVTLTAAQVRETQLIGADGRVYDLNDAPADQLYTSALNLQKGSAAGFDRWGVKVNYGQLTPTHFEEGYVDGRAAGALRIVAPTALLQGRLDAHVTEGTRQSRGDDRQPTRGQLTLGAVTQAGVDFSSTTYKGAVLRYFNVSLLGPQVDEDEQKQLWADAMAASLPAASGMKRETLTDAGFGQIAIAASGRVSMLGLSADAELDLGDEASLRLLSSQGDVLLGGQLRSAGGSVELSAKEGHATLADGAGVQLQGRFVNALRDGPSRTTASSGGRFSAAGQTGLTLGHGSLVDVSGGAVVDAGGQLAGGNGGSIVLAHTAPLAGEAPGLELGGTLRGDALGAGGTLSLTAPEVQIGGSPTAAGVQQIDPAMLSPGGFGSVVVDGRHELQVAAGTAIHLARDEWVADPRAAALAASGSDWHAFANAGPLPGVAPAAVNLTLKSSGTDATDGRLVMSEGASVDAPARSNITLSARNQLLMDGTLNSAGGQVSLSIAAQLPATPDAPQTMLWLGEHARIDVSGTALLNPTTNGLRQGQVLDGGRITLAARAAENVVATEPVLVMQQGAELVARGASATLDRAVLGDGGVRWTRERVDSNGGTLSIEANRALVTEAQVDLHGGGTRGAGGTLAVNLQADPTGFAGQPENLKRELRIAEGPTEKTAGLAVGDTAGIADLTDTASISAATIRASGAANLSLGARDGLRLLDGVDLDLAGTLTLASRALALAPGQASRLDAGQVVLQGVRVPDDSRAPKPVAREGDATLEIHSRDGLVLAGDWVTQGLASLSLAADGDLMLHGVNDTVLRGSLTSAGDVKLTARQLYPGTASDFRIAAAGHDVTIAGTGAAASQVASPLSAGGRLTITASTLAQGGIVRAPQGQIVLEGTESVTLAEGSTTSVSADGLVLPYGQSGSGRWVAPGDNAVVEALPTKRIDIASPTVTLADGATVDLQGGGDLVAYEFVAGRGGSNDVFAGGNGAYALVPSVKGAAWYDATLEGAASLGRQIEIGANGPVPAGSYTLLPARYALQPGAFLVEPVKAGTPLAVGTAIKQADGSVWVGARLSTAGTGLADAQSSTWRVSTRAQARTRSEIRETSANAEFAARAAQQGQAAAERPVDAGTLSLATTDARIDASIAMAGGKGGGVGGRAEFTAANVVVGDTGDAAPEGTLRLDVATLNQLGAQTLVLGARSGAGGLDDGSTALEVGARTVTVATAGQALAVPDLVLAAQDEVRVASGSVLTAAASAVAPASYTVEGDGAALRLASAAGAGVHRQGATLAAGALAIEDGVRLDAGSGSLTLDASGDTKIAGSARLAAGELTLGSPTITIGGPAGGPGVLSLTPRLLAQVSQADQLTLHAYRSINLKDGAALGEDAAGTPTLNRLVLDTPALRVTDAAGEGARITAGQITLTNGNGLVGGPARAGEGRLVLHASSAAGGSGDIRLGEGRVTVQDAAALGLEADNAIALAARESTLAVGGDATMRARGVVAESAGAALTVQAGGTLSIAAGSDTTAPPSALGGAFHAQAQAIHQDGRIVLPAGEVVLDARDDVVLGTGSRIDVSGRTVALGEATVDVGGGRVELAAQSGDVRMLGGVVNVSGAGQAAGGQLALSATQGAVQIDGQLRGTSAGTGAELSLDSGAPVDLAALARHMDEADPASFSGAIRVHQRQGDLQVGPQLTLAAREIELATDGGALTVQGTLDARDDEGGRISLASREGLTLASGAVLQASATADGADGGRVELSAAQGSLQLQSGSRVDVSAAEGGDAGRLTLRAARLGVTDDNPGGTGVDIGTLRGEVTGAGRIDVEAVKVYDGITTVTDYAPPAEGRLLTGTLATEGLAFVGTQGTQATQLAGRLAGGDEALQSLIRIHAAAEIRGEGDLDVNMLGVTWAAPSERADITSWGGDASAVGDSSITLRAAGDLTVRSSIDAGFHWSGARSEAGGSLHFVAGADLGAASATAVQRASGADLAIGRTHGFKDVLVRTTTGDITLAAAGDIDLAQGNARLYSTGVAADDAAAQVVRQQLFDAHAFRVAGGDIRVEAGASVRSRSVIADDLGYYGNGGLVGVHPNAWQGARMLGGVAFWDARPSAQYGAGFQHGVASFGGGRIDVHAGLDVVNLTAASPSSGFLDEAGAHQYGGGSVRVSAARDVVNGVVQSGGSELNVTAGRDVAWVENPALTANSNPTPGLQLAHERTAVQVSARRDLTLGASTSSHALNGAWVSGLDVDASLSLSAAGGDLGYRADAEPISSENKNEVTVNLLPTQVRMAAPSGSIDVGGAAQSKAPMIQQAESAAARLELLAAHDVVLGAELQLNASWTQGVSYHDAYGEQPDSAVFAQAHGDLSRGDGTGLDRTDRTPARVIAAEGDIELQSALRSARPLRILAAGDIALTGTNGVDVQQQGVRRDGAADMPVSELTLLQAGRDITLGRAGLRVAGPGDLVLLAGRDLDQGAGSGVQAVGNVDNSTRLAEGSAAITLVAGLRADGADYAEAARRGYAVLGSSALAGRAADLYAWLAAPDGSPPPLGSAEAKAFGALGTDGQLERVKGLLGDTAYDAGIVRYVRGLVGHERDSAAQAVEAFAALSEVKRAAAPAALLAGALSGEDAASRLAFIAGVARADTPQAAAALQGFMQAQTGESLSLEAALAAFEQLPIERQLLRLNAVLVDEVRTNGRAAVAARLADEKEAAYDRGYAAINALFPVDEAGRPAGDIRLPTTQARTLQGSGITLLAPGGAVNAGETGSSTKSPSELGIVTIAGGDIAGIARDDILVNQSRIFTLAEGDILLWSSTGDVDAGRGAKTVVGAPAPVYRLDENGRVVVDTSGSFSGSGIAVLDAKSALDLYAPAGAIDAGEAGIRALGTVTLGADVVRGADDIVGGSVAGAPPAAPTVGVTAGLAKAADAATAATRGNDDDEEERRRKRRARRQLLLEFLGFGRG